MNVLSWDKLCKELKGNIYTVLDRPWRCSQQTLTFKLTQLALGDLLLCDSMRCKLFTCDENGNNSTSGRGSVAEDGYMCPWGMSNWTGRNASLCGRVDSEVQYQVFLDTVEMVNSSCKHTVHQGGRFWWTNINHF